MLSISKDRPARMRADVGSSLHQNSFAAGFKYEFDSLERPDDPLAKAFAAML